MKMLVEKGAFLNTHFAWNELVLGLEWLTPFQRQKAQTVVDGGKNMVALAKKYGAKITFCVDAFGDPETWDLVVATEFTARRKQFSDLEILRQATANAADLLNLSGKRNPYRDGPLGRIGEGAYADLLIVDGNPLDDVTLLADAENNIRVIVKGGEVYKNTL